MAASLLNFPQPNRIRHIQRSLGGNGPDLDAGRDQLRRFGSSVEDLRGRTSLLEGVVAYGNVSMTRNEWVVGARPILRFGHQVGEMKGVSITPAGDGLILESEGCWRVDCHSTAAGTGFTGDPWVDLDIEIHKPVGTPGDPIFDRKRYTAWLGDGQASVGGPVSFVPPAPGYRVFAFAASARWRRMLGGTLYSQMSVNKWDNRTTHGDAPSEVGDGPGAP
ncbi:hypothetical protein [Rhodococcus daqingensis]|uniref:Uncharacterized protein n=1 Tax=Rhodococcus daqingensis TaxID=2479363 RepID=A0ABW2S4S2_9NOCA